MKIIDTHGHLNFQGYDEDRQAVIERIQKQGMKVMVPSSQLATSQKAVQLAGQYDFLFAAIGIHPIHVFEEEFDQIEFQKLVDTGHVSAIGETGMDYYHVKKEDVPFEELRAVQEKLFKNFIDLAHSNDLPLIVHCRPSAEHNAYLDVLRILKEKQVKRAVIHCYTGRVEDAQKFVAEGYFIGITGIVTFDKTGEQKKVVESSPLEQLLIETDAPYLSPEPYRGKRNEPSYVIEVARKMAEIKGLSLEQVVGQVTKNAELLFKI